MATAIASAYHTMKKDSMETPFASAHPTFNEDIQNLLSVNATIEIAPTETGRWSEHSGIQPAAIVTVACVTDVQALILYCTKNSIRFIVQSGGHGAGFSPMPHDGITISMRGMNSVTFNDARTECTIEGGALVGEVSKAAYQNDARILTGTCDTVGHIGAALGGGFGNLTGIYGLMIDQILSLDVVMADGKRKRVTQQSEPELWWALRGAGPNFGVVTSIVMKCEPMPKEKNTGFIGAVMFSEDKVEKVIEALSTLEMKPEMVCYLFLRTFQGMPLLMFVPFYLGTADDAKKAYAPVYDVGPFQEMTGETPMNMWNAASKEFCLKGGRKPFFGADFNTLNPKTWGKIWATYKEFLKNPDVQNSAVLLEIHAKDKVKELAESSQSCFPWRNRRFACNVIGHYNDAALDDEAAAFLRGTRDLLRGDDDIKAGSYINFSSREEPASVVYGESEQRLRELKQKYDPKNVFNQWFSLA